MPFTFSMLDLPLPWLTQLAGSHLDSSSKQAAMQSCTQLRDIVMSSTDRVQCELSNWLEVQKAAQSVPSLPRNGVVGSTTYSQMHQQSKVDHVAAARTLRHLGICKEGAAVELCFRAHFRSWVKDAWGESDTFLIWLQQLCDAASCLPGLPLHHITSVDIYLDLDGELVPPVLTKYCPNMRKLMRREGFCQVECPTPCPQLHELDISTDICGFGLGRDLMAVEELRRQLRGLPKMQALTFSIAGDELDNFDDDTAEWAFDSLSAVSTQLTSLHMPVRNAKLWVNPDDMLVELLLSHPWPQLQVLNMPGMPVTDVELQLLLDLPQLTDLEIKEVELEGSFAAKQTQWKRFAIQCLSIPDVLKLPLAGVQAFAIGSISMHTPDLQHTAAALEVLSKVPQVLPGLNGKTLKLAFGREHPSIAAAETVMPLLEFLQREQLQIEASWYQPLEKAWLSLLARLHFHTLILYPCTLATDCWPALQIIFPQLQQVQVRPEPGEYHKHYGYVPDRIWGRFSCQLTGLCMLASRPLTLWLDCDVQLCLSDGWKEHVVAYMKARGHQNATVVFDDGEGVPPAVPSN